MKKGENNNEVKEIPLILQKSYFCASWLLFVCCIEASNTKDEIGRANASGTQALTQEESYLLLCRQSLPPRQD